MKVRIKSVEKGELGRFRSTTISVEIEKSRAKKKDYRNYPIAPQCETTDLDRLEPIHHFDLDGESYYGNLNNPPYHEVIPGSVSSLAVRRSVGIRLQAVNNELREYGLKLWIYDAWRPIEIQNYFHDEWMPKKLQEGNPSLKGDELISAVEQYWARGAPNGKIDPLSPPPHSTGAAVDLTIRTLSGGDLFMGSIFDDVTSIAHTDFFEAIDISECYSYAEAQKNRRMLYWLMRKHGFANNPTEWWHYSHGDQMWAKLLGKDHALVSCI